MYLNLFVKQTKNTFKEEKSSRLKEAEDITIVIQSWKSFRTRTMQKVPLSGDKFTRNLIS